MTITQDSSAPLVAVVGATGTQGGSVIKALSESPKPYRIRGFTRDASKPSAQALAKQGVEMVSVTFSVDHKEHVHKVFEGATYAFVVTNFWEHHSMDREVAEGKMMIDAAKAANVRLLVWSGLENFSDISGGKYTHVLHFDGKAKVTAYAKEVGIPFVNVECGQYFANFLTMASPKKQEDGSFILFSPAPPDAVTPLVDTAHDYGLFVQKAIEQSEPGTEIFAHGDVISGADLARQWGEVLGKKTSYVQVSEDQFKQGMAKAGVPEPVAIELLEMYLGIAELGYFGKKDLGPSLEGLERAPRTWVDFIKANDWSKVNSVSVINALSESPKPYRIRAFTRDANKDAAKALANRGVEVVAVNFTVENKEEAFKAFEGATYAFVVTNFWEHMQQDKEIAEGKMLVDAAAHAKVKLLVWSGLESMAKASSGKYNNVFHFDGKAMVTEYAKTVGIPAVADVQAGMYMENYLGTGAFALIKKQEDGSYTISNPADPESTVPLISTVCDYGLFVRKLIEAPNHEPFTSVYTHSEVLSQKEIARQLAEGTGKDVTYHQVSEEDFKKSWAAMGLPEIVAQELYEGYASHSEFGYYGNNDIAPSLKGLARTPRTWVEFIKVADWGQILN
ncbi:hypothetical protein FRB96_004411 [Tulasnella sp. 330]|nr:hypothetical protein FRB96_004411 [Tulasnella sp. 330]